jgi:hypothetical protein
VEEPLKLSPPCIRAEPLRNAAASEQIPPRSLFVAGKIFCVVERLIEKVCARRGLVLAMKGSLSSYPGCVHWHYKRQNQKGTLELTLFAQDRRVWAKVQDGRKAPWIDQALPGLQAAIEDALNDDAS